MKLAALMLGALVAVGQESKEKELREMDAASVVEWMTKETRKKFVYTEDMGLRNKRIRVAPDAFDPKRAYEVGVKLLMNMDLAVVPSEGASGVVDILPAPIACKRPLAVYASVEALPRADEFCVLSLKLKHTSPRNLQAAAINVVSFPQCCLSVESSGHLIVSDYASNLRKVAELVKLMDVPGPPTSYRIAVAILEATKGDEASVPEAFKALDLAKATGANRFRALGELSARFEVALGDPPRQKPAPTEATLRFRGAHAMVVDLAGSSRGNTGPVFERFTVSLDREGAPLGDLVLQTRVELKGNEWVIVGVVPANAIGTSLVILGRAMAEK